MYYFYLFSGNANNGTSYGSFYLNLNNASSNSNTNIGTGLSDVLTATPLGGTK